MQKLKLSLNDLAVESFETQPAEAGRGTVHGHETQAYDHTCDFNKCAGPGTSSDTVTQPFWTFCVDTCDGYGTCYPNDTCGGGCGENLAPLGVVAVVFCEQTAGDVADAGGDVMANMEMYDVN